MTDASKITPLCTLWRNEIERTQCTLPDRHDGACVFEYGETVMDDELIEAVAQVIWDDTCEMGDGCHITARAILPIARKHYAEVFAKVAEWADVPATELVKRKIASAIRQAGEA